MSSPTPSDPAAPSKPPDPPAIVRLPLALRMLIYGTIFLFTVLVALPWLFFWIDVLFPAVHMEIGRLRWVGWAIFLVSLLAYLVSSFVLTSRGKGPFVEFDPPKELVITGPYHYVRNPIVACLLGTMLGEALAWSSTGILLMFCVFAVVTHGQVTRIEEPLLKQRYGQAFEDYCARVPRWFPRLW